MDWIAFGYLSTLLLSILGLVGIDQKHKLILWIDPLRGAVTLGIGVIFFLIWDLFGIALGVFFRGSAPHLTGILLAPELPIEEVFFLILLSYTTLICYAIFEKRAK